LLEDFLVVKIIASRTDLILYEGCVNYQYDHFNL
jgi:hypothetical protein